jgi:hypothetical protein
VSTKMSAEVEAPPATLEAAMLAGAGAEAVETQPEPIGA